MIVKVQFAKNAVLTITTDNNLPHEPTVPVITGDQSAKDALKAIADTRMLTGHDGHHADLGYIENIDLVAVLHLIDELEVLSISPKTMTPDKIAEGAVT